MGDNITLSNGTNLTLDTNLNYSITIENTDCLKLFSLEATPGTTIMTAATNPKVNIRIDVGKYVNIDATNQYVAFEKLTEGTGADIKQYFVEIKKIIDIIETDKKPPAGGASKRRLSQKAKHARRGRRNSRKSV